MSYHDTLIYNFLILNESLPQIRLPSWSKVLIKLTSHAQNYFRCYVILHVATLRSLSPCGKKVFLLTTGVVFAEMVYFMQDVILKLY